MNKNFKTLLRAGVSPIARAAGIASRGIPGEIDMACDSVIKDFTKGTKAKRK